MKHKKSVLTYLLIMFLIIELPLITIGLIALNSSNQNLTEAMLSSVQNSIRQDARSLNEELTLIHESSFMLYTDTKLEWMPHADILLSPYERVSALKAVTTLLTTMKRTHSILKNARVYMGSALQMLNTSIYPGGTLQSITQEQFEHIQSLYGAPSSLIYDQDRLFMLRFNSIDSTNIIEVELDQKALAKLLNDALGFQDSFYYFSLPSFDFELTNIADPALRDEAGEIDSANESGYQIAHASDGSDYYVFTAAVPYAGAYIARAIPGAVLMQQSRTSMMLTALFIITMLLCAAFFFLGARRLIHRPLTALTTAFGGVKRGELSTRVAIREQTEFSYLYEQFNAMAEQLEQMVEQDYRQKLLLQRAELKQMQAQINPHFLYNSFFLLQRTIKRGLQEDAETLSQSLGDYFKYITRNSADVVALMDEWDHASIYAHIQGRRFDGRITVEVGELPGEYAGVMVPKLILQPIIENAFNYGLDNKASDGLLRVRFAPQAECLRVLIDDNGDEFTDEKLAELNLACEQMSHSGGPEATGILNIYRRLFIYYGGRPSLFISRSELGGMLVEIVIRRERGEADVQPSFGG